jgi:hypothetical protein
MNPIDPDIISLDDRLVRWIGIPFFGLVIPSATGLIRLNEFNTEYSFYYLYFIFVAWVIWEGNRFLLFRNYPVIYQSHSIVHKYLMITGLNIFYTGPVAFFLLYGWRWITGSSDVENQILSNSVILIVVCVIFVTNFYEKVLFSRQSDLEKVKLEQLERGKIAAELEALKNQIDPHFMFNALNSLSYLVDHDREKAQLFINNLAEVFRYILSSKDKDLVLLEEELSFMHAYQELVKIRYGKSFNIDLDLSELPASGLLIPPVSMMVAVENAVKHNAISGRNKLVLKVNYEDPEILFANRIFPKKTIRESTGLGLTNLNERFKKLTGKEIRIDSRDGFFRLYLPLLKLTR